MRQWLLSYSGDRAVSQDEATGIWAMAFLVDGKVYGQVGLRSLCRKREARVIVGPFAHLAAFVDVLWSVRSKQLGEEVDEGVRFERVDDATLPRAPSEVPFFRKSNEPMHPSLAVELLWRAQIALDVGDDVDHRLTVVEQRYPGSRTDPKNEEAYAREAEYDFPADAMAQGGKVDKLRSDTGRMDGVTISPPAPVALPNAATLSIPPHVRSGLRASKPVVPLSGRPMVLPAGGDVAGKEEAAQDRRAPDIIDWSKLPVCVVEQKITAGCSYLKAKPRFS